MLSVIEDTKEAIQNAADNGYPVDDLSDDELAAELWLMAGFTSELTIETVTLAVKEARRVPSR